MFDAVGWLTENNIVKKFLLIILIFSFATQHGKAQKLAFPSAEGSGRYATGGRGGSVYEVTNLNNSGAGSIVDAVNQGNRTIVFRVSGTIELGNVILKPKSNTTIAGQTAPGDGICIKGRIQIDASNIIIRYIRVRVDAGAANSSGDAIDISSGSNIIIDHVSASYARDEGISCQETSNKVTVQWCIISEGLTFENHSYGSLIRGDYGDEKTYHHNLYAHNISRLPRPGNYTSITTDPEGLHFDFRNNVVYNWKNKPGYNDDVTMVTRYNFVGNAYIKGPASGSQLMFTEKCQVCYGYFKDNSYEGNVPDNPWDLVTFSGFTQAQIDSYKTRSYEVPMEPVNTTSPAQALIDVLAAAGASFPKRDTIDRRIVNDVLNKTGSLIASTNEQPEGGWPILHSAPAPADADHDGIPDSWETERGLNPNDSSDGSKLSANGYYTNLENYLNELVGESITSVTSRENIPLEFSLKQNYPNPFNPTTTIQFTVAERGFTTLKVFTMLGQEVAQLFAGYAEPGIIYSSQFHAVSLAGGAYFSVLESNNKRMVKKIMLLK